MEVILLAVILTCIIYRFKEIAVAILVICLFAFLLEHKIIQGLFLIVSIGIGIYCIRKYLMQQEKYKNETPEERQKREELLNIREWSRRNKC